MEKSLEAVSPLERLAEKHARTWPAILRARQFTEEQFQALQPLQRLKSDNTTIVVFGSFARGELTSGSDVDWSLLIDGPADPEHFRVAQEVDRILSELGLLRPGATETFGTLASSHELIHLIGGIRDANQNMTRRVLLLLEARSVTNPLVYERVVRGVLNRYIISGASVSWSAQGSKPAVVVPRFLLNDIVRFWRTMAVDYAAKRWEQSDRKWALRNAKLRMSRKLLFAAGLLMCFNFELTPPPDRDEILADPDTLPPRLAEFFLDQTRLTPLELVAQALLQAGDDEVVSDIMDSYDLFLQLLDDEATRKQLEMVKFEDAGRDPLFQRITSLSERFQRGLTTLFFEGDTALRDMIIKYGVF